MSEHSPPMADPWVLGTPVGWGLLSIGVWASYVLLKGWHALSIWERRQVAFGVFTALLFLNFLTMDEEFQGWADVYYFCGRKLQYCNCNFRWNARGWAKAYILWSFVLSSAAGLQRVVIQLGLNGLLPGEEVVTRESIVSICWRLIPYWLNNWEQQWGAECSSMMFELPHFAVELLVILPCIQILCARLKILAMPLVHAADNLPGAAIGAPGDAAAPAAENEPAVAAAGAAAAAGEVQLRQAAGGAGARARRGGMVVARDDFAPNILKGYWERRPEQRKLFPRLRANLQVMLFSAAVTALAASNALLVPLMLEASVTGHAATRAIQLAGQHLDWFSDTGLNQTALHLSALNQTSSLNSSNLTGAEPGAAGFFNQTAPLSDLQQAMLNDRLEAFQAPRLPLLASSGRLFYFPTLFAGTTATIVTDGRLVPVRQGRLIAIAHAAWRHLKLAPLRSSLMDRDIIGVVHALLGTEMWQAAFGWGGPRGMPLHWPWQQRSGAAQGGAAAGSGGEGGGVGAGGGVQQEKGTCKEHVAKFRANLAKHAEEIQKMEAAEHRALIPLVESALAVMRLSCEKYFVLLSVYVAHLLFREHPPHAVRAVIRFNARLSTAFQKVILYSFPAVCWVYGAGVLFSLFVSAVFWGSPIMATYESVRGAISTVRIRSLRHATAAELERMGGNCTICWGDMHIGPVRAPAPPAPRRRRGRHAPPAAAATAAAADGGQPLALEGAAGGAVAAAADGPAAAAAGGADGGAVVAGADQAVAAPEPVVEDGDSDDGGGGTGGGEASRAWSLPCGHAYHHGCLSQWLTQCHTNGMTPTCPMCQAAIRLEVQWRFPMPWRWPENEHFNRGFNDALGAAREAAAQAAWGRVGHGGEQGAGGGDRDSDDDSDDEGDEVGAVVMPMMNGGGLGRQRAAGRVRGGALRPHENLLLPPPMAALGHMNMLRLLDHQRELQELLQDMPQIPPPDDVAQLQLVAAEHQLAAAGELLLPPALAAARPAAQPRLPAAAAAAQRQPAAAANAVAARAAAAPAAVAGPAVQVAAAAQEPGPPPLQPAAAPGSTQAALAAAVERAKWFAEEAARLRQALAAAEAHVKEQQQQNQAGHAAGPSGTGASSAAAGSSSRAAASQHVPGGEGGAASQGTSAGHVTNSSNGAGPAPAPALPGASHDHHNHHNDHNHHHSRGHHPPPAAAVPHQPAPMQITEEMLSEMPPDVADMVRFRLRQIDANRAALLAPETSVPQGSQPAGDGGAGHASAGTGGQGSHGATAPQHQHQAHGAGRGYRVSGGGGGGAAVAASGQPAGRSGEDGGHKGGAANGAGAGNGTMQGGQRAGVRPMGPPPPLAPGGMRGRSIAASMISALIVGDSAGMPLGGSSSSGPAPRSREHVATPAAPAPAHPAPTHTAHAHPAHAHHGRGQGATAPAAAVAPPANGNVDAGSGRLSATASGAAVEPPAASSPVAGKRLSGSIAAVPAAAAANDVQAPPLAAVDAAGDAAVESPPRRRQQLEQGRAGRGSHGRGGSAGRAGGRGGATGAGLDPAFCVGTPALGRSKGRQAVSPGGDLSAATQQSPPATDLPGAAEAGGSEGVAELAPVAGRSSQGDWRSQVYRGTRLQKEVATGPAGASSSSAPSEGALVRHQTSCLFTPSTLDNSHTRLRPAGGRRQTQPKVDQPLGSHWAPATLWTVAGGKGGLTGGTRVARTGAWIQSVHKRGRAGEGGRD